MLVRSTMPSAQQETKMEEDPSPSPEPTMPLEEEKKEVIFNKTILSNGDHAHTAYSNGGRNGKITILDANTQQVKHTLEDVECDLTLLSLTDKCLMTYGKYLYPDCDPSAVYLGGGPPRTHKIKIWDLDSASCIKEMDTGEDNAPRYLRLSTGILAYASDQELTVFNVTTRPIQEEFHWSTDNDATIYKILGESHGNLIIQMFDHTIALNMQSKAVERLPIDSKTASILVLKDGSILTTTDKGYNVVTQILTYNKASHHYDASPYYCLDKSVLIRDHWRFVDENFIFPFQNNVVIFRTDRTLEAWKTTTPNQALETIWECPDNWVPESITLENSAGKLLIKGRDAKGETCEASLDEVVLHPTHPLQNELPQEEDFFPILEELSLLALQRHKQATFYEHAILENGDSVSVSLVSKTENKIVISDKKSGQEKFTLKDDGNDYEFILFENNQLLSLAYYTDSNNVALHRIKLWDLNTLSCVNQIEHPFHVNSRPLPRGRFVYFIDKALIIRNSSDKSLPRELRWESEAGIEDIVGESHEHLILLTQTPHNLVALNLLNQTTTLLQANVNSEQKYALLPQSGRIVELTSNTTVMRLIRFDEVDNQFKTAIKLSVGSNRIDEMFALENDRLLLRQNNLIYIWDPKYLLQEPQLLWTELNTQQNLKYIKPLKDGQLSIQTKGFKGYQTQDDFFDYTYQLKSLACFLQAKKTKSDFSGPHVFWNQPVVKVDSATQYDSADVAEPKRTLQVG
jgi:hypothetical protein